MTYYPPTDYSSQGGLAPVLPGVGTAMIAGVAVTPTDNVALSFMTRWLYIGGGGNVTVIMSDGNNLTFEAVPTGTMLPIRCGCVMATGTSATNIVAGR